MYIHDVIIDNMDLFKSFLLENWGQKHLGDFFGSRIIWPWSSKYKVELKPLISDHWTRIHSYIFIISTLYLSIKMKKLVKYTDFFYLNAGTNMVLIFFFVLGLGTLDRGFLQYELFVIVLIFFLFSFLYWNSQIKKGLNEIIQNSSTFYSMVDGTYHFFSALRIS